MTQSNSQIIPKTISADDLYNFHLISKARISPDGKNIVYVMERVDQVSQKKFYNLWIAPNNGDDPYQFTFGDQTDTLPSWSPDNQQIVFLSNRNDKNRPPKLFVIRFSGGEAKLLIDIPGEIKSYRWSPDGSKLLCVVRKFDPEELARHKDEDKNKLGIVARHYDRLFYKLDGEGYLAQERAHLWVIDTITGEAQQITDHPVFDERDPDWSPDGYFVTYISNRQEEPDKFPDRDDLFVREIKTQSTHRLPTSVGPKSFPQYSPDGSLIAYFGRTGEGEWYKNNSLWMVAADGSSSAVDLLDGKDIHVDASTINDMGTPELMPPIWSVDGKSIYFQCVQEGSTYLMKLDVNTRSVKTIIGAKGVVINFSLDKSQENLAYLWGQINDPGQLYLKKLSSGVSRQITKTNRSILAEIELGEIEEVWIKGPDGNDLQGWILKPPGFDPNKKYPSILEIHGGPLTQYGYFFMHEFYFLAASGYVVHFSNPRGGRGYGEDHAKAIWGRWGSKDYDDLMSWTDYVAKLPYIDSARMGVTGGSYGGFMTVWIIGHTNRFKAAVTQRCVSNMISMWGSSDRNWVFQKVVTDEPPFKNVEKFWQASPIAYIGNATTPTLVIHSEMDLRCPIEQGEQVFVALKRMGVDTEFIRFPDEFHGLSRNGRTDRRVERLKGIRDWFDKYLGL